MHWKGTNRSVVTGAKDVEGVDIADAGPFCDDGLPGRVVLPTEPCPNWLCGELFVGIELVGLVLLVAELRVPTVLPVAFAGSCEIAGSI